MKSVKIFCKNFLYRNFEILKSVKIFCIEISKYFEIKNFLDRNDSIQIEDVMGWYTTYTLKLDEPIRNFDASFVDSWCSKQEKYIDVNYMRYQYTNPYEIHVVIKYGREDILGVRSMIKNTYCSNITILVQSTDDNEWSWWRDFVKEQFSYL